MKKINPIARAVGVIGATAALVTGVTFAALSSTATLTDNTITSATADLVVNNNPADTTFSESEAGFAFEDLIPGEESDPESFQLRNQGDVSLDVYVQITGESALPAGVDPSDIVFTFTNTAGEGTDITKTWGELVAAPGALLIDDFTANPSASADYDVTVKIDDSVSVEEVNIPAFDLTFTGTNDPNPV